MPALPNIAIALTIDIDDAAAIFIIHTTKADAGDRLWRAALHIILNEEVSYSGSPFQQAEKQVGPSKNQLI
ncbi:hypothetical protein [Paraglaciecola sp.]|uniref:hypothetical protein n=1 Tax=Paraglaciecola sp. TaxID=1920173 RepID=UPI0030F4B283